MKLEWDPAKRTRTLEERGLDFADVVQFGWETAIYAVDQRREYGEERFVAFGFMDAVFVSLAYTIRNDTLRVISLRRANRRERKIYDRVKSASD